ncbi:hypothetical protein GQR58_015857 [Nymphon striatum]|nr:hypothetical protein GQR58_015857 [Nymphon striatum]
MGPELIAINRAIHRGYGMSSIIATISNIPADVAIQWIPSHVGIAGDEKVDYLAKTATCLGNTSQRSKARREFFLLLLNLLTKVELLKEWMDAFAQHNDNYNTGDGEDNVKVRHYDNENDEDEVKNVEDEVKNVEEEEDNFKENIYSDEKDDDEVSFALNLFGIHPVPLQHIHLLLKGSVQQRLSLNPIFVATCLHINVTKIKLVWPIYDSLNGPTARLSPQPLTPLLDGNKEKHIDGKW